MKRAKAKSRKIAVTIVVFYLVSWLPYYVTMLVFFLTPAGRDTVSASSRFRDVTPRYSKRSSPDPCALRLSPVVHQHRVDGLDLLLRHGQQRR